MKRLGIDLGGTEIKFGVVAGGEVLAHSACATPLEAGYEAVVRQMAETARPLLERHPEIRAAGVASAGLIDPEAGMICFSNNFGWRDKPLRQDLQAALGLEVEIENDAHCAALGEALYGAGQKHGRVAMLTIGTGVGGGFVRDGKLDGGRYGSMAYVFGHSVMALDGKQCNCGRRGCLECYASAGAIDNKSRQLFGGEGGVRRVFEAAREGDAVALKIVNEFVDYLAEGVVNIANTLRPHVVVIGGGVAASGDLFLPAVNRRLEKGVYGFSYAPVYAVQAALGNTAGLVGAAALCDQ